jgi:uncharacterized protein YndB with AHSA1/START domain
LESSRRYRVHVAATPEKVWQAFTDPDKTEQYYFGSRVESDWGEKSPVSYAAGSQPMVEGTVIDVRENARLVTTFNPHFLGVEIPESKVAWEVQPVPVEGEETVSAVSLTHEGFDFTSPGADQFDIGWVHTVSSLKTLLETGRPLPPPAMA